MGQMCLVLGKRCRRVLFSFWSYNSLLFPRLPRGLYQPKDKSPPSLDVLTKSSLFEKYARIVLACTGSPGIMVFRDSGAVGKTLVMACHKQSFVTPPSFVPPTVVVNLSIGIVGSFIILSTSPNAHWPGASVGGGGGGAAEVSGSGDSISRNQILLTPSGPPIPPSKQKRNDRISMRVSEPAV